LVTPQQSIRKDALLSARDCDYYINVDEIRKIFEDFKNVLTTLSVETRGKSAEETKYLIYESVLPPYNWSSIEVSFC